VELLRAKPAHIDELAMATGQSTSDLLALLLELELKGVVQQLPGKCFALVMVDGGEVVAKK
jgi:DNA processing protein